LRAPQLNNGAPTGAIDLNAGGVSISGASPTDGTDVAIKPLNGTIINASSIVAEGFQVYDLTANGGYITHTITDPYNLANGTFGVVDQNGQSFASNTAAITNRLLGGTVNAGLASLLHVRPGEELVTQGGSMSLASGNTLNVAASDGVMFGGAANVTFSAAGTITHTNGTTTTFAAGQAESVAAGDVVALNAAGTMTANGAVNNFRLLTVASITINSGPGLVVSAGTTITFPISTAGDQIVINAGPGISGTIGTLTIPAGAQVVESGRGTLGPGTYPVANGAVFSSFPAGTTFTASAADTVSLISVVSGVSATPATVIVPGRAAGIAYAASGSVGLTSGDMTLPQNQDWNFNTFRYGPNADTSGLTGAGEPGILTLRAAGNLVLLSSITDGFTPIQQINNTSIDTLIADFVLSFDPRTQRWNDILLPPGALSWSYRLAAGADLTAADFHQVVPLADLPANSGSVELGVPAPANFNTSNASNSTGTSGNYDLMRTYYQVVRTGTGDIDVAAGRDVQLLNPFASIYTAGTQVNPVATSTLNPGGTISLAANVPIVFPNAPGVEVSNQFGGESIVGVDTVTATTNGTITYRPSAMANPADSISGCFCTPAFDVEAVPAGSVFTFTSAFNPSVVNHTVGATPGDWTLQWTATQTTLSTPAAMGIGLSGHGSISGLPSGVAIPLTNGDAGLVSSSAGILIDNTASHRFNANTQLPSAGTNASVIFDNPATLTATAGGALTLPQGTYSISGGFSLGNGGQTIPAGTVLTKLSASGGLFEDYSNFQVVNPAVVPVPAVVVTIPIQAGTPITLLPGTNSITLFGNGTLSLSSASSASSYYAPSLTANSTSYAFDMPVVGGIGLAWSTGEPTKLYGGIFSAPQYSTAGGNVTITAGEDIAHAIGTGQSLGFYNGLSLEQPTNWLYRRGSESGSQFAVSPGGDIASTTWWIDFSNFTQGIGALGGGNVTLKAGRDVTNVAAVVPTNAWMPYSTTTVNVNGTVTVDTLAADQPLFEYGGGNLAVTAGRNITGGVYYAEKGNGALTAGGAVMTNQVTQIVESDPLPTTLYLGKGRFEVKAGGDVLLGPVANPFLLPQGVLNGTWDRSYFSTYAATDSVNVSSLGGSITLSDTGLAAQYLAMAFNRTKQQNSELWLIDYSDPGGGISFGNIGLGNMAGLMPPALRATAFSNNISIDGALTLSPSPVGTVDLEAKGSVGGFTFIDPIRRVYSYQTASINLSDANPAAFPTVNAPLPAVFGSGVDVTSIFNALLNETGATLGLNSRLAFSSRCMTRRSSMPTIPIRCGSMRTPATSQVFGCTRPNSASSLPAGTSPMSRSICRT
jgi:hypothetical protein